MTEATLLFRQVHPSWVQSGRPTSQAFRPTPKDNGQLSAYDGDLIAPAESWLHFTNDLKQMSAGVLAVTVGEFKIESLPATSDPDTFPSHVLVDYTAHGPGRIEKKSKRLRSIAEKRGWQHVAPAMQT